MNVKKRKIILFSFLIIILISLGYIKYHKLNFNDVSLKILSWIKKTKGESVDLAGLEIDFNPKINHNEWDSLLVKNVDELGKVNYIAFIQDSIIFKEYLKKLSENPPANNWLEEEKLAYWINVYNAFTIDLIIDNYPIKSIKNISDGLPMINSPWDIKFFKIGNIALDLNTVEHEILRKQFEEPRIHFAINCASISCPKLRNQAYKSEKLEQQLEEQTHYFINNSNKNIINKNETKLSKIFDWFNSDFNEKGGVLNYIKKYKPELNQENKVDFLEYDWGINE